MEFKINKIEMDVRQRINEERSMDKVHGKKGIEVNKDKELVKEEIEEKNKKLKNAKDSNSEENAEKKEKDNNEKESEREHDHKGEDPYRGHFIDIKR